MTESGFRPTGTPDLAVAKSHNDFAMLEPREQLATLLKEHVVGRPFSELAAVTFDHRAATVMGHVLIDALEDAGYTVGLLRFWLFQDKGGLAALTPVREGVVDLIGVELFQSVLVGSLHGLAD